MAENEEQKINNTGAQGHYKLFNIFIKELLEFLKTLKADDISELIDQINNHTKEEEPKLEEGADKDKKNKVKKKPWLEQAIEVIKEEENNKKKIFFYALWLWYMPISNIPVSTKNENLKKVDKSLYEELLNNNFPQLPVNGLASYGQGITFLEDSILFLLDIFKEILEKKPVSEDDAKKIIVEKCRVQIDISIKNMLLHLCDQDNYEPIANTDHKKQIVEAFTHLKDETNQQVIDPSLDVDKKIKLVKEYLKNKSSIQFDDFYQDDIKYLWMNLDVDNQLSDVRLLEYKKALVLYGPPGTGKTYSAKLLANSLVRRHFLNNGSLPNEDIIKKQIAYLQFHINYNYEDFIAGQTIKDNTVRTKKGFIFKVIEEAQQAPDVPYVVILDEMNRTDVSRVFGELFTAIEKRGEDVVLSLPEPLPDPLPDPIEQSKNLILNLPDNIYFIGTMNEIDFSLEKIDFALRRRFIWQECGYSTEGLKNLMDHLFKKNTVSVDDTDIETYVNVCTALNKEIEGKIDMTYHIGHSFFAEIVKIYKQLSDSGITDKTWLKAKNILWQISIKPTLEAYCGTMSKEEKGQVMPAFEKVYFPEKQEKKAKSKNARSE